MKKEIYVVFGIIAVTLGVFSGLFWLTGLDYLNSGLVSAVVALVLLAIAFETACARQKVGRYRKT